MRTPKPATVPDAAPTPAVYVVELPLPPVECSRNTSCHWRKKGSATKQYRSDCAMAYRAVKIPALTPPITLGLEFYNGGRKAVEVEGKKVFLHDGLYRPRDESGGTDSFKAGQDALADAGIVPNDSRKYVKQGPTTIYGTAREHKGKCGVVLTITVEEKL